MLFQAIDEVGALVEAHVPVVIAVNDQHGRLPGGKLRHWGGKPGHLDGLFVIGCFLELIAVQHCDPVGAIPIVYSVNIDAGRKEFRIFGQGHRGQESAIRAAVHADFVSIHEALLPQPLPGRFDVAVLGRAPAAAVRRILEIVAIPNAQTVIDRQHHKTQTG